MSEIVVGTDGSAASREALLWALEQAVRDGSRVTAVFVWRIPLELEIPFDFETISSLRDDLSRREITGFPQITAASLRGPPGPVLVERARDADLLVVGARHHTDLRGSVSSYCLHHSRTPVVVVPGDASSRSTHPHRRVAVGVDLTPESAVALRWASGEAFGRDAELVVAHAWQVKPGSRRAQEARAEKALRDWVCEVLGPTPPTPIHLHADHGGPLDALLSHAADADLLVIGSRGHHTMARLLGGSMCAQLAVHSECPVVVVPETN